MWLSDGMSVPLSQDPATWTVPAAPAGQPLEPRQIFWRGIAVLGAWYAVVITAAVLVTIWLANQPTDHCEGDLGCNLGPFFAALAFVVWFALFLLFSLAFAVGTLAAVARRLRTGLGAGHVAAGVGLVGGGIAATVVLVVSVALMALANS